MQDTLFIEDTARAGALLHPLRVGVLKRLATPRSCPEIAKDLDETTQKIYYHVKILERSGLVDRVEERRVRGIVEGVYQARARSYWLSPQLVGRVGGPDRARDQLSLGFLLSVAEEIQTDVGRLSERAEREEIPSLGLSARIELRDANERAQFREELQALFEGLARKYGRAEPGGRGPRSGFQLSVVCYPKNEDPS